MTSFELGLGVLEPHFLAILLCSIRLFPIALLCPLLGGAAAPSFVKLGVVLSLGVFLHWGAGIEAPVGLSFRFWPLLGAVAQEALLGTALGLMAALPFDAARMGGSFVDLFRGSSAEAMLPFSGTKEAAMGDWLYQVLLALVATTVAFPLWVGAVCKSFTYVGLAQYVPLETGILHVVKWATLALGTGLAIGAPVAAASLLVDLSTALITRFAPQMNIQEVAAPLRILLGALVFWLGMSVVSQRLLDFVYRVEVDLPWLWKTMP